LDARHLKAATSAMPVKTDRIDARNIAWALHAGWYRAVHVKSQATHRLRALLRSRAMLVSSRVDLDNHLPGILKAFGLKVGKAKPNQFEERVLELVENDAILKQVVDAILGVRSELMRRLDGLHRMVLAVVRADHLPSSSDRARRGSVDGAGLSDSGRGSDAFCQSVACRSVFRSDAAERNMRLAKRIAPAASVNAGIK
jgi:transposase